MSWIDSLTLCLLGAGVTILGLISSEHSQEIGRLEQRIQVLERAVTK